MNLKLVRDTLYTKSDDRTVFRLPKTVKQELKTEADKLGYKNLSQYLLAIVLGRPKE